MLLTMDSKIHSSIESHMKEATVIYPHQLFEDAPILKSSRPIYLVEDQHFFTRFRFHKQKLAFHKATMLEYADYLKKKGFIVIYTKLSENLYEQLRTDNISKIHISVVHDHVLQDSIKTLSKKAGIDLTWHQSPYFMTSNESLEEHFANKEHFYFTTFYNAQRRKSRILMVDSKPKGGSFSYDPENRLKLPKDSIIPQLPKIKRSKTLKKALVWADTFDHFGINTVGADKGKGSIMAGIDLLRRSKVLITRSSSNIRKENRYYQWKTKKDGSFERIPKDFQNHTIDAIR